MKAAQARVARARVGSDTRLLPAALAAWAGAYLGTSAGAALDESPLPWAAGVPGLLAVLAVALLTTLGWAARWVPRADGLTPAPTVTPSPSPSSSQRLTPTQARVSTSPPPSLGPRTRSTIAVALLLALSLGATAWIAGLGRVAAQAAGPVVEMAKERATVEVLLRVTTDPLPRARPASAAAWRSEQVRLAAVLTHVRRTYDPRSPPTDVNTPVVLLAPKSWSDRRIGDVVAAGGRLSLPSRAGPAAAVLLVDGDGTVTGRRPTPFAAGDGPRQALRTSVAGYPAAPAGLLPSLVVGDETLLTDRLREQLRVTGLAHLTAVSGANVAIVMGAALLAASWLGLRGRALAIVGLVAVGGFVLLARPEPSVVRASAMGVVVVVGLTSGARRRGPGALMVAVVVLLLADPWLARSVGFALSTVATLAIVVLARPWARASARWMPRPLAAALAVPLAAQVACTPLLVGMAGEVSLSAVPANVLAAPAVPPATVLGVVAAGVGLVAPGLAHLVAGVGMVPSWWIVTVAERAADLPGTSVSWAWGVPIAMAVVGAVLLLVPVVLRSPIATTATALALALLLVRPADGWPPEGWQVVACDVGQGDAIVLRAGPGQAVVVDAGPDPWDVDRCLSDLEVTSVPLLVVTHFHSDHVGGAPGVGQGRDVGGVLVTIMDEPREQSDALRSWARSNGVPVHRAQPSTTGRYGSLSYEVLWPTRVIRGRGSAPNQASLVMRARAGPVSVMLTGDIEPAAQRALLAAHGERLRADVLKVPHHGATEQHPAFIETVDPAVALVSVGADNTYGHPDADFLTDLQQAGAVVARTDRDGDVAVVVAQEATAGSSPQPDVRLVRRGSG